jgi:uncharacterized protein
MDPEAAAASALAAETRLRVALAALPAAVVAYSGGVDSTYLLAVAQQVLGPRVTAVTADSASLPREDLAACVAFCAERGIAHRVVPTAEFSDPAYLANDGQRCARCKTALMDVLSAVAGDHDAALGEGSALLLGAIADDADDFRPGMQAARARGARFPLLDAGLGKAAIRSRSRALGLPTAERPAQPCLASRIPYGEPVSPEALAMVEQAEAALHHLGFATVRARHHTIGGVSGAVRGALCRIEVPAAEVERLVALRHQIDPALRRIGYARVALDLAGFESGGFNQLLSATERGN